MKNPKNNDLSYFSILITLLPAMVVQAQDKNVLDPLQHPPSEAFAPGFPEAQVPLDAKLSWVNRFTGDENFNPDEVLDTTVSMIASTQQGMPALGVKSGASKMDAKGVVKQIKSEQGKIKIEHGPIESLGMPAMTMVFKVDDLTQLDGIEEKQQVNFDVDNSSGGFKITRISAVSDEDLNNSPDANGMVISIRSDQQKVKVKHGPIERLGMPAMTMMFKVEDPIQLEQLNKGDKVGFSVDNSSGGFVITDIRVSE